MKHSARSLAFLLVISAGLVSTAARADGLKFRQDSPALLQERVKVAPETAEERLKSLRTQFLKAGCAEGQIEEQQVPGASPSLVCTLPGKQPGAIVFAAPYDYNSRGDEAQVQWGTVALLPALAGSLKDSPRRYTLVLAAFGGDGRGDKGATEYLKRLGDKGRKSVLAMIDLDRLGRTPFGYHFPDHDVTVFLARNPNLKEPGHPDTVLSKALVYAADVLSADRPAEIRETPRTAAKVFQNAKIDTLGLQSPAYTVLIRPGNTEIKQIRSALDMQVYNRTYELLCVYALVLDAGLAPPQP